MKKLIEALNFDFIKKIRPKKMNRWFRNVV